MVHSSINNISKVLLQEELKADYGNLTDKEFASESIEEIVQNISKRTNQQRDQVARNVEQKLEYILSKGI